MNSHDKRAGEYNYRDSRDTRNNPDDRDGGGFEIIEGRNAVTEALRASVPLNKVFIVRDTTDSTLRFIASKAKAMGIAVVDADRRKLDAMSVKQAHGGVVAQKACAAYVEMSDILDSAEEKGEIPLIVLCDEISDPHNLGAIIRTCEATGAHGVIIPKRRSAGLGAIVAKTSSGAVFHLPVARVTNLTAATEDLKKRGVWVFGAAADGETQLWDSDFTVPAAMVIGSEGKGISRLVREHCDVSVRIPMAGKISSLNASVSAAILLYEALRQRRGARYAQE